MRGIETKSVAADGMPAILDIGDEHRQLPGSSAAGSGGGPFRQRKGLRSSGPSRWRRRMLGAKTNAGEQQQNRAVSETRLQGWDACGNDSLDFLGLQIPRQGRKAPVCEGWNACVEARCALPIRD